MASATAKIDVIGLPKVKALYDAAKTVIVTLNEEIQMQEALADYEPTALMEAHKLLADALKAFKEA